MQAFVGPNNSGKSNVLRFFYEFRELFRNAANPNILPRAVFNFPGEVKDPAEVFSNKNREPIFITLEFAQQAEDEIVPGQAYRVLTPCKVLFKVERDKNIFTTSLAMAPGGEASYPQLAPQPAGLPQYHYQLQDASPTLINLSHYVSACQLLTDTLYIPAYRNPVNAGGQTTYYDLPIGDAFINAWTAAYSGGNRAQNIAARAILDEVQEIFGYERFDMPSAGGFLQTYVDGNPVRLDEQGSGIAQFVMVLFSAEQRKPSLLLVDEPELHLHPRLQLSFLAAAASRAKLCTLFATHSLGLARSAAETIFSVRRSGSENGSSIRDYHEIKDLKEVLGELSFAGNYDLGNTAILLIEGRTEYKIYQEFLRKFNADQKVTLLSLGGGTLINGEAAGPLSELRRLSDKIFAVVDSDRTEPGGKPSQSVADFRRVCESLGIPILVYERRAIENYLGGPHAEEIQGILGLDPFDAVPNGWSKDRNWRIAREMSKEELMATDIGRFLLDIVLKDDSAGA